MASIKVTYSLDPDTVNRLERTAERLGVSKSAVVREAIADYSLRVDRLGERERLRMLELFDRVVPAIPRRPLGEVERELEALRQARRAGGRGEQSGAGA